MPQVTAQGKTLICDRGANLRQVFLQNNVALHHGNASFINCHGLGSCGTYAVEVGGEVSEPNWRDRTRRSLPPHDLSQNRRLVCQTKVLGDARVKKFNRFWGQGTQPLWAPEG